MAGLERIEGAGGEILFRMVDPAVAFRQYPGTLVGQVAREEMERRERERVR